MDENDQSHQGHDPGPGTNGGQKDGLPRRGKALALLRCAPGYLRHGILFYWYTGERRIAIAGASVTTILYLAVLWVLGARSLFALVLLLMMDHLLIIFMILYMIAVRPLFPGFLAGELDAFVASYWLFIVAGWVGNRVITNAIASRLFGFDIYR